MTVQQVLNEYGIEEFRIVVFLNWKTEVLYDSAKTKYDMPVFMSDSIVESVNQTKKGIFEIEI